MAKSTDQMAIWSGDFGKDYTNRNPHSSEEMNTLYQKNFGVTRTEMNQQFIGDLDRSMKILEVGANVGAQLQCLQDMGFKNLHGIELLDYAVELAKKMTRDINIIQGSAFDIPFEDGSFDLVFTSGVLIHISPSDIGGALKEIHRATKKYIWGFEYFAENYTEVKYRGNENLLWKTDFAKLYLDNFKDLRLVKEKRFKYKNDENVDSMFLLEKIKKAE